MDKKNREIAAALSAENKTPTERFWDAKEIMDKEARILRDCPRRALAVFDAQISCQCTIMA